MYLQNWQIKLVAVFTTMNLFSKLVYICSNLSKLLWNFSIYNFRLTDQGGCCIYYNEPQLLADIEEHLGVTIQQVGLDIKVSVEFLMSWSDMFNIFAYNNFMWWLFTVCLSLYSEARIFYCHFLKKNVYLSFFLQILALCLVRPDKVRAYF